MIAQCLKHGHGGLQQTVFPGGGGQLLETRPQDEAALHVAGDHAVVLQCDGEAVGGGACEPRAGHELRERCWPRLKGTQDQRRLIEDSDTTGCLLIHTTI